MFKGRQKDNTGRAKQTTAKITDRHFFKKQKLVESMAEYYCENQEWIQPRKGYFNQECNHNNM